jgi:hypothetical protein
MGRLLGSTPFSAQLHFQNPFLWMLLFIILWFFLFENGNGYHGIKDSFKEEIKLKRKIK